MPTLNWKPSGSWGKELFTATIWVFATVIGLIGIFLLLGGFHGRGGYLLTIATAPIGLLHLIGVGNGTIGGIVALFAQFGSMLAIVLIVRTSWRICRRF